MKQYRKKPVTIEAVQFDGLNPTEIKDFVGKNCEVEIYDNKVTPPVARIVIHTLEGDMEVSKGDYVIKGVKGEFYPCKPDIFEQTYESAETQKELEEAAEEFYDNTFDELGGFAETRNGSYDVFFPSKAIRDAFIAGAEWQEEEQDQPITGNSLEQEWLRYVDKKKKECRGELPSLGEYGWLQIARHFAEWQKSQMPMPEDTILFNKGVEEGKRLMMEDAVEGEVIVPIYEGDDTWSAEIKIPGRYEIGQKVRIIVVKADEE